MACQLFLIRAKTISRHTAERLRKNNSTRLLEKKTAGRRSHHIQWSAEALSVSVSCKHTDFLHIDGNMGYIWISESTTPELSPQLLTLALNTVFICPPRFGSGTGKWSVPLGAPQFQRSCKKPEAEVVVAVVWVVPVPVRRLAVVPVVVPTAATVHTVRAFRPPTINLFRTCCRNFQVQSPGVRVNETSAVERVCNSFSDMQPIEFCCSSQRHFR